MDNKIIEIIKYYSESHNVDFKFLPYPTEKHDKKNEILKDISAMANHLSDEDKYIIIGFKRKNGTVLKFSDVTNPVDQAEYQQFLDSNIEPQINFDYQTTFYEGHQLAYFKIHDNTVRPYLFTNNVRNSLNPDKIDFKKGDGYIRVGTSTNKMTRDDFEKIYEKRYKIIDRKSDIKVTPYINECEDGEFSIIGLKYFDFRIENLSNQSINLDVELKIYKNFEIAFVPKYEFENELAKAKGGTFPPIINSVFSHVRFENHPEYLKVSRVKLRTENAMVHIAQNDLEDEIFSKMILYKEKEPSIIKAEISIRSDSFTDGFLVNKIELAT